MGKELFLAGHITPPPQGGGGQGLSAPHFSGFLSIYTYTVIDAEIPNLTWWHI